MQLFIKCYLSKNFNNLGKHLHVKMKKEKIENHINYLLQFCFNPQEQKDWEGNRS